MIGFRPLSADIWKGMAIWIVVIVHFVAAFPEQLYLEPQTAWWSVPFQSFVRLSVPLFLALSGFGLTKKYSKSTFQLGEFFSRRLGKLLPFYVLWSLTVWATLELLPQWRIMPEQSLGKQLLLATADYQLYFVFLIFQLYALFPIFQQLSLKALRLLTLLAFAGQGILAMIFRWSWFFPGLIPLNLLDDQILYRLFFNWWGYFLLGMVLAKMTPKLKQKKWILLISALLSFIFLAWSSYDSWLLLQSTRNVIFATSFLRLPVILFCISGIVFSSQFNWENQLPRWVETFFQNSGQYSFIIFLSHTTLLRIILSLFVFMSILPGKEPPLLNFGMATFITILALVGSFALLGKRAPSSLNTSRK